MSIKFEKNGMRFRLRTKNTEYDLMILHGKYPVHLYYGKKVRGLDPQYFHRLHSFSPYKSEEDEELSLDEAFLECPFFGSGDFRSTALKIKNADGNSVTLFTYKKHRIFSGRREISGLPFARADEDAKTLEITMTDDEVTGCTLKLYYTVFEDCDVISRYSVLENHGKAPVDIEKMMSLTCDIPGREWDMISLHGAHCWERNVCRLPVRMGSQSVFSRRGASSHQFNPFIAIADHKATEERGSVYGFNFVYSGNFLSEVEQGQEEYTRVQVGIGSENFGWRLEPGEVFEAPEAVMTYSASGIGQMSRNFHKFTRAHILPPDKTEHRPVVLNSWEAVFFDIDEKVLIDFARESRKYGIDMLVMDDGWFGKRVNDRAGLGDWFENRERFPDGLKAFAERVKAEGVGFGIWIEPEMVNPDSDLYRAHPEWTLRVPGRTSSLSRHQLVLDMSNRDVVEYLKTSFEKTFGGVPIDYIKWDMNRHLSEVGSDFLPPERQKEVPHRYMLGVYELLSWFRNRFPDIIIETCSGGGGRYDLGMMRYGEQIWTSDLTLPAARTVIQYGSTLAYPAATMSCHVSHPGDDPDEIDYRWAVAIHGMLGYEMNILTVDEAVKARIPHEIEQYREYEHLIKDGELYRLKNPPENGCAAYYYTNGDSSEILLSFIQTEDSVKNVSYRLKISRAERGAVYIDRRSGERFTGDELRAGIVYETAPKHFASVRYLVKE